jgi:hypothetical protein
MITKPKPKKCAECRQEFMPYRSTQKVCSPACAQKLAEKKREKVERAADRQKRESLKTLRDYLKETQIVFNAYIRERDRDMPCISCGRHHTGSYDAGHYRSVGAAPQLRFNEDNCHKQCVPCNQFKSGNAVEYRIRLIGRIGLERVQALESECKPLKITIDEAKQIKALYKAKLKELKLQAA